MTALLPYLQHKSFPVKFLTLLLLIAVFFVIANVIGILIAIPIFGLDVFLSYGKGYDLSDQDSIAFLKYLQVISQIGVFILPAYAYAWLFDRRPVNYLELRGCIRIYPLFVSLLVIVASIPFINFLVTWNESMSMPEFMSGIEQWMRNMENQATEMTDAFLKVDTAMGLMVNLLIIGLLAAIGEELLFRGVILKMFRESVKNVHLAVFFSALLFSAFHGQFYGFVPRAVLGVMFGYIFVWTGSLWVPILLHLLFNSVSVVVAFLFTKGLMDVNYGDFGESSGGWIILLSAFFSVALMVALYQRHAKTMINQDRDH